MDIQDRSTTQIVIDRNCTEPVWFQTNNYMNFHWEKTRKENQSNEHTRKHLCLDSCTRDHVSSNVFNRASVCMYTYVAGVHPRGHAHMRKCSEKQGGEKWRFFGAHLKFEKRHC